MDNKVMTQQDMMNLLDTLYGKTLNGVPKVSPPVDELAEEYLKKYCDPKDAAKKFIDTQVIKCTTSGVVTGLGGIITLPVTVPANIASVLYVQMRMITAVAYMSGLDIKSDEVQTFVYACLAGVSIANLLQSVGVQIGEKLAVAAIKKIPGKLLVSINQKVGFRLITKFGTKGVLNLGKMVPGIGAVVGGVFDFSETKIIGNRAIKMFFDGDLMLKDDKSVIAFEDVDEVAEVEVEVEDFSSEEVIDCVAPNA